MVADCGATCAKYFLCLFNFIFFVVGASVCCVGVWLIADQNHFLETTKLSASLFQLDETSKNVLQEFSEPGVIQQCAYVLVALGTFIFIVSFLGYCGAIKESRVMLTAYALFLIIIFVLQVAAISLAAHYKTQADTHTRTVLKNSIRDYYGNSNNRNAVTIGWDLVMSQMDCCGVNNSSDFQSARLFNQQNREEGINRVVPAACCRLEPGLPVGIYRPSDEHCEIFPTSINSFKDKGCLNKFTYVVRNNLNLVIGTIVGVAALQLLGIIFAFCVCKAVGAERDFHYKY